jgi:hypothetical protein
MTTKTNLLTRPSVRISAGSVFVAERRAKQGPGQTDDPHIEGCVERSRHLVGDCDTAARKAEDDGRLLSILGETSRELAPCVLTIVEQSAQCHDVLVCGSGVISSRERAAAEALELRS